MNITDIRIRKIYEDARLKALVSVTIDGDLAVHDIKVIEGPERLFVAMPSRKDENGTFRDIAHPITPEARHTLEEAILDPPGPAGGRTSRDSAYSGIRLHNMGGKDRQALSSFFFTRHRNFAIISHGQSASTARFMYRGRMTRWREYRKFGGCPPAAATAQAGAKTRATVQQRAGHG